MVFGVLCGLVCALCVLIYIQGMNEEAETARAETLARYGGEQVEVCVARRDIAIGEVVDAGSVETRLWISDLLPDKAVRSIAQVEGKKVSSAICAGEVLVEQRFQVLETQLNVPRGLTAVSVPAKDVQAVGGAIGVGNRVDIYATGGISTDIIARNVLVLATSAGTESKPADTKMTWITVAVRPELVQETVAAAQRTELYFTLPSTATSTPADSLSAEDKREGSKK